MYIHVCNVYIVCSTDFQIFMCFRGNPRLGGLSVEKTDDRKEATQKELLAGAEVLDCVHPTHCLALLLAMNIASE
jgi:hypothetical protein